MRHLMMIDLEFIPDELEDIYSLEDIGKDKGEDVADEVFKSLKSINELVVLPEDDEDHGNIQLINGGFSYQVLSFSMMIIQEKTNIKYTRKVAELFHLDCFIDISSLYEEVESV
jgi:hypothetical protein